ncbi:MAG: leucine-rich repeat domain-containing protein [Clostridia bacterium]|nr:leucine-rich repeat domain-containing protein [Clostridia bacterium]
MQNKSTSKNPLKLNINEDRIKVVDGVLIEYKEQYRCEELIIPKGVIELGKSSIASSYAKVMYIPTSVDIISSDSILYAFNVTRLYIENPEIYLGVGSLEDLPKLKEIYIGGQKVDTVVTQKDGDKGKVYLERYVGNDKSYKIDDDINIIGTKAFINCENLESVEFSQSVCQIKMWAFQGCSSLREVKLSDSVNDIDGWAFAGCTSLAEINLSDSIRSIWPGVFEGCTGIKELTVPLSVNYIASGAFKGWQRSQSIRLPRHFKKLRILQKWRKGCKAKIIYY